MREQRGQFGDVGDQLLDQGAGALMVVRRLAAGGFVSPARDLDFEAAALHTLLDGLSLQTVTDPQLMPDELVEQIVAAHVADLAR